MRLKSPFIITISRQFGSGGAFIGQQLAKELNILYADHEIIRKAAKQLSVLEKDIASYDEKVSSFWKSCIESFAYCSPDTYVPPQIIPTDRALFEAESEIIKHIAQEHSVVIIGRCGSYILRDNPNHVSVFVYSNLDFRKSRVQKLFNVTEEVAEKMIIQSDKEKALYHQTFTGKEWTDARQYDICIDSGKIGLDKCAEYLLKFLD